MQVKAQLRGFSNEYKSFTDFDQGNKELDKDIFNEYIKLCEKSDSNFDKSSNNSYKNSGKNIHDSDKNEIPNQNSTNLHETIFINIIKSNNNLFCKDDFLYERLNINIENNNEANIGKTPKQIKLNYIPSTNYSEDAINMEIENEDSNDDSTRKKFETRKKIYQTQIQKKKIQNIKRIIRKKMMKQVRKIIIKVSNMI